MPTRVREVLFPRYRTYVTSWRDANNAMMALLAGSRLAAHTLSLTEGSHRLLPEIFPNVPHIGRFSLKTEMARQLLLDADEHLGAVAVPYALAVHEDFVMSCLDWLDSLGLQRNSTGKPIRAWNMHAVLFESCEAPLATMLPLFHLLREMRNAQIHAGGATSANLGASVGGLSASDCAGWERLTGRTPGDIVQDGRVRFTTGDIVAVFAVTKGIGRDVNGALQGQIAPEVWASEVTTDYAALATATINSDSWMRGLRGYARQFYGAIGLTDDALEAAAARLGVWSRPPGAVLPSAGQRKRSAAQRE